MGTNAYVDALVRSGRSREEAIEISQRGLQSFIPKSIPPVNQPKTTTEGKVVTPIDLPIPKQEPQILDADLKSDEELKVLNQNYKEKMAKDLEEYRNKIIADRKNKCFKRIENDGYVTIVDGKAKVIDGYEKPRFVKKAAEAIT